MKYINFKYNYIIIISEAKFFVILLRYIIYR